MVGRQQEFLKKILASLLAGADFLLHGKFLWSKKIDAYIYFENDKFYILQEEELWLFLREQV